MPIQPAEITNAEEEIMDFNYYSQENMVERCLKFLKCGHRGQENS